MCRANKVDPFYIATRMHMAQLMTRYGVPMTVLNLVKVRSLSFVFSVLDVVFVYTPASWFSVICFYLFCLPTSVLFIFSKTKQQDERQARETILGDEFARAIDSLNVSLPTDAQIQYIAVDMKSQANAYTIFYRCHMHPLLRAVWWILCPMFSRSLRFCLFVCSFIRVFVRSTCSCRVNRSRAPLCIRRGSFIPVAASLTTNCQTVRFIFCCFCLRGWLVYYNHRKLFWWCLWMRRRCICRSVC